MRKHRLGFVILLSAAVLLTMSCGNSTSTSPTTTPSGGGTTSSGGTTPSASADVIISIVGINGSMSFSPGSATVKVGQTVAWRNDDTITHRVAQDASGGFETGNLSGGATSRPIMMGQAGTLPYHCTIHPSMVGTLTVTE